MGRYAYREESISPYRCDASVVTTPGICIAILVQPMFVTPWMQCRHTGKLNFKKPKSHYDRKLMFAITSPVYPKQVAPSIVDRCGYLEYQNTEEQVNPYEEFLRKECRNMLEEYPMIIFVHHLPTKGRQQRSVDVKLHKSDLFMKQIDIKILRHVIGNSKYENVMPLLSEHVACIVSKDCNAKLLLATTKKLPNIIVLGGIYENRILSAACLAKVANIGDLDGLRSQLSGILMASARSTNRLLGSQQQKLSSNLEQYIKDKSINE